MKHFKQIADDLGFSDASRAEVADFIFEMVSERPEWAGDLSAAVMAGLEDAYTKKRDAEADLAYGFAAMIMYAPKVASKHAAQMKIGLMALRRFFSNAPVAATYDKLLEAR